MHKSVGAVFCFFVLFCFLVQTLMFLEIMQEHTEAARDRERERHRVREREEYTISDRHCCICQVTCFVPCPLFSHRIIESMH